MGTIKSDIFEFNEETNYMVTLKFDKNGFYVNGKLITRGDFEHVEDSKVPEWPKDENIPPEIWTYPDYFMQHFQGALNYLEFGSMEGSTRTWSYYEYIKYHKTL